MRNEVRTCLDEIREALKHRPAVLTLDQASTAVGVSTATMRRWIADGRLRAMKTTPKPGGRFRTLRGDLVRLLEAMAVQE